MPKTVYEMTYNDAKSLMDSAVKSAQKHKVPGAIAIVDKGGNPILLESLDHTMSGASKIAIGKAATSVAFKRPSIDLEKVILEGRTPMLVLDIALSDDYVPLKGGHPRGYKNEVLGGSAGAGTMEAEMDEV